MTIAEIHGKSPYVYSEDVLTANVFTAFRYLPAEIGIVGFLRSIKEVAGIIPAANDDVTCEFYFWPRGRYREPDVLLEIEVDRQIYHILIEAKYRSGPSDMELFEVVQDDDKFTRGNQLADQLQDLNYGEFTVFQDGVRNKRKRLSSRAEDRMLLYLTAQPMRPIDELEKAAQLFPAAGKTLVWSNWYHLYDYLSRQTDLASGFPYNRIVGDVLTLLKRKGFSSFEGITQLPNLTLDGIKNGFWTGRRRLLPAFSGILQPPAFDFGDTSRIFWKD